MSLMTTARGLLPKDLRAAAGVGCARRLRERRPARVVRRALRLGQRAPVRRLLRAQPVEVVHAGPQVVAPGQARGGEGLVGQLLRLGVRGEADAAARLLGRANGKGGVTGIPALVSARARGGKNAAPPAGAAARRTSMIGCEPACK